MWISPKTLYFPVLASFANSKLLDFSRASDGMTLRINRKMCVACYIRYVRLLTLCACALRHDCKMNPGAPPPPSLLSLLATFRQSWDDSARDFFLTRRVCMLSCQLPCAFLWYPLTLWLICRGKLSWCRHHSAEFDTTHQGCCCYEPSHLEQHCCASITLALSPAPIIIVALLQTLYPRGVRIWLRETTFCMQHWSI